MSHGRNAELAASSDGDTFRQRPIDVRAPADPHAAVAIAQRMVDDLEGSRAAAARGGR